MSEAVWDKAFTQGSRALQDRLKKVHAKNPKFQAWLQKSGHGAGASVKQASKEVKATERVKKLQAKSLAAYGATKGAKVGGEHGSDEVRDTIAPLTRDQHSKVQAAERASKAAAKATAPKAKKPLSKAQRMAAIAAAVRKSKTKHDVPTVDPDDMDHDDLKDLHQSLHVSRTYNEEVEVNEGKMKDIVTNRQETERLKAQDVLGGPVKTRTGAEPKGKLPLGFRTARNLARKALKKGAPVTEGYEYTNIGHPPEHSVDVDPMPASDPLKLSTTRKKPVKYKPGMKDGVRIREESTEETKMNKGRLLAKAIMAKQSKHPLSQNMGEAVKDVADLGEYDYEGDMAKSQLRSILVNAKRLHDMLEDQDNLPEWVQSKITLAEDYILTAASYMEGEMNEETIRSEEAIFEAMKKMADEMDDEEDDDMEDDEEDDKKKEKMDEKHMGFKAVMAAADKTKMKKEEVEQIDEVGGLVAAVKKYGEAGYVHDQAGTKQSRAELSVAKKQMTAAAKERGISPKRAMKVADRITMRAHGDDSYKDNRVGKMKEEVEQVDEVKAVKAYDKEGKLVGRYRSMDHAKQMKPGHTYKVEEEVVTEAEGKVAVTPQEKTLAAHHGDPKKITYGDVIKARIKSAAAKAMNKGK